MPAGYTEGGDYSAQDKEILPFTYTVEPGTEQFGFKKDKDRVDRTIIIGSIDFSDIKPGTNNLTLVFSEDENNIFNGENDEFSIVIEADGVVFSEPIALPETMALADGSQTVSVIEGAGTVISVVGPSESVALITADNFVLDYENGTSNNDGTITVPVILTGADDCWIYGRYSVVIEVIE